MKGTLRGNEKKILGEDGRSYFAYAKSWQQRSQYEERRNDLVTYDVTFEIEAGKIKEQSLVLVPKEKPREAPSATMAERRLASPVIVQLAALPLDSVQACTLFTLDKQLPALKKPGQRELQERNRESFASLKEFFAYTEQGFQQNAALTTCLLCGNSSLHSAGAPQTFRQYYRLDEFAVRREELSIALDWKRACTCNGWVFPHPPNNVYRRASDDEHSTIVQRFDRGKAVNELSGRRPRDALLRISGVDPDKVEDPKINHLVPKSGGGCPVGLANLQVHAALCPPCQKLDDLITRWQSEDKEYFRRKREEAETQARVQQTRELEEQELQRKRAARQEERQKQPATPPDGEQ